MNYLFGFITIGIGIFFIVSAFKKSEFVVYKLFVAKSKPLWKENVYNFHKVVGFILVIVGILFILYLY